MNTVILTIGGIICAFFIIKLIVATFKKNEQKVLNRIPNNWADDIDNVKLKIQAEQVFRKAINQFAKEMGMSPNEPVNKIMSAVLIGMNKDIDKEVDNLRKRSVEIVKIMIFSERYGHLLKKDSNGELILTPTVLVKITGY